MAALLRRLRRLLARGSTAPERSGGTVAQLRWAVLPPSHGRARRAPERGPGQAHPGPGRPHAGTRAPDRDDIPTEEDHVIGWLETLLAHMAWADGRAVEVVRAAGGDRPRELLAHVLATERVWLARIREGDSSHLEIWPDLDVPACEVWAQENAEAYRRLLEGLDPPDVRRPVPYRNTSGERFRTPLGEILLHVALHGEHHRGQIAREIRQAGGEPVNTDVITFVRQRPRREKEEEQEDGDGTASR